MRIPSKREVRECVVSMTNISIVGRRLTSEERRGYQTVAELVQSTGSKPLNISEVHVLLNPQCGYSGVFRPGDEVRLGVDQFYRAYTKALNWNLSDELGNESILIDWYIAAFGRCVRPFIDGNAAVFYFVEHHLLQVHGMPWREKLLSKEAFSAFREMSFGRVFRHLVPQES